MDGFRTRIPVFDKICGQNDHPLKPFSKFSKRKDGRILVHSCLEYTFTALFRNKLESAPFYINGWF